MNLLIIIDFRLLVYAFPVVMLLFVVGVMGWIWAISTQLHHLLPPTVTLNVRRFKRLFLLPFIYILALAVLIGTAAYSQISSNSLGLGWLAVLLVPLHLLAMACILYGLRFAAKTLKSVELQREAHVSDYLAEFFLLWFSFVGVWFLQPRLNALVRQVRPA